MELKLTIQNYENKLWGFALIVNELVDLKMFFFEKINKLFHLILGLKLQKWLFGEKINFVLNLPYFSLS
jgi:hypothetical protein